MQQRPHAGFGTLNTIIAFTHGTAMSLGFLITAGKCRRAMRRGRSSSILATCQRCRHTFTVSRQQPTSRAILPVIQSRCWRASSTMPARCKGGSIALAQWGQFRHLRRRQLDGRLAARSWHGNIPPMARGALYSGRLPVCQDLVHWRLTYLSSAGAALDIPAVEAFGASPDYVVAAKGAPEAIADLCHLDAAEQAALLREVRAMAAEGLRVLGVAKAAFTATVSSPHAQHDFAFARLGLIGLADPLRPEVPAALRECHTAAFGC
jgi:hypothetical protein